MATILVVEDNVHMHRIYADKLRRDGYQVVDAFNGVEGVTFAAREKPAAILLDLMMPKMDGYQVLERLKAEPSTADIPVIVISNKGQPADIERALMLGARSFFCKGMTLLDDLALEMRKLCRLKKALIVSARPGLVDPLSQLLSEQGFLCSANAILMEIVSRAERERPDVLFLDAQMPGLNPTVIILRLQANAKTRALSIVLVDNPSGAATEAGWTVAAQLATPIYADPLAEALKRCVPSETRAQAA